MLRDRPGRARQADFVCERHAGQPSHQAVRRGAERGHGRGTPAAADERWPPAADAEFQMDERRRQGLDQCPEGGKDQAGIRRDDAGASRPAVELCVADEQRAASEQRGQEDAGMFSMMAPKIEVVILKFAKPAELKIQTRDGVKLYSSDAKQAIKLKFDAAMLKDNPTVTVSERPTEAELDSLD